MKTFFELREATSSADKEPEKYTKPDGKVGVRMVPADKEIVKEEDLDEISLSHLKKKIVDSGGMKQVTKANKMDKTRKDIEAMRARLATNEKTLTPAEKKKREEIATAMERDNPGMDMSKKMAIATAQAKKVAEEQTVDEAISNNMRLISKIKNSGVVKTGSMAKDTKPAPKKEEALDISEISTGTLQRYKSKASKIIDNSKDEKEVKKRGAGYAKASKKLTARIMPEEAKPDAVEVMRKKNQMATISTSDKDKLAKVRAMLNKEKK